MGKTSHHFIPDENMSTDNSVVEMFDSISELRNKNAKKRIVFQYKLGQEIANGVRYFGREKIVDGKTTAMCVCPDCGELWRVKLHLVNSERTKSCGCKSARGRRSERDKGKI